MTRSSIPRRNILRWAGAATAAGLSLPLATPLVAGCAGAPESSDDTEPEGKSENGGAKKGGTFSVYWNAGHAYQACDEVIADFEKAHGVTVNYQKYQWPDLRTRLLADYASGNVPDLVEEPGGWVQEFAISGDALSLQSYVDKDGSTLDFPADWQPGTVERNSYEGEVFGIQLHYTCMLLLYNKAMLDKAGIAPPTTWEELLAAARELTGGGVHGIALNQDAGYSWPWMLQNGVQAYDPDREEVLVPRDAAIEALQFQADLIHKHKVSPVPPPGTDYSGPQKLLSANRAAMIITGPWDLLPIDETSPDFDLGIAPALRKVKQATSSAGTSVFVPAKAKNPDLAWDFIKRITKLDVERRAAAEADMLMPRVSWANDPKTQENERYKAFAAAFDYAVDTSQELRLTGKFGEINELYITLYQSVVMKNTPAEEAVATYVSAAQKVLGG